MTNATAVAALVAGAVFSVALAPGVAEARVGVSGIRLDDPYAATPLLSYRQDFHASTFMTTRPFSAVPFQPFEDEEKVDARHVQLELQTPPTASGFQISLAQRALLEGVDDDLYRYGRGSEVRVALGDPSTNPSKPAPRFYMFAAADNEALTWQPGGLGFLLRERVEIGDHQAGVTYEFGSVQASLALVERKVSATVGQTTTTRDESFAGFTLTMRH